MAVFSVNQVRQFYVAKQAGDIVTKTCDGGKEFYFDVTDALGKLKHTDHVAINKIDWVHYTAGADMDQKLKVVEVTVNDDALIDGNVIPGQDYILRINLKQYIGMSDEDIYQKYGAVHGVKNMSEGVFLSAMAASLFKNFSRDEHVLDFYIGKTNSKTKVAGTKKNSAGIIVAVDSEDTELTSGTSLIIKEVSPVENWARGTMPIKRILFDVVPTTVTEPDYYNEVVWGKAEQIAAGQNDIIPNCYTLADMEWFYHGYRGDQYRYKGWPNAFHTEYMVEVGPTTKYDVLDIQYYYSGDNEDIQHSAKTMTIVGPAAALSAIVSALEGFDIEVVKKADHTETEEEQGGGN